MRFQEQIIEGMTAGAVKGCLRTIKGEKMRPIILDMDIGNDVDDIFALIMFSKMAL